MTDEETNRQCQEIDYFYQEFLSNQNDLLHTPIEELLSRFYFAGFEKAKELSKKGAENE